MLKIIDNDSFNSELYKDIMGSFVCRVSENKSYFSLRWTSNYTACVRRFSRQLLTAEAMSYDVFRLRGVAIGQVYFASATVSFRQMLHTHILHIISITSAVYC